MTGNTIHNRLIADFEAFTQPASADLLFTRVDKAMPGEPDSSPYCVIQASAPTVEPDGITTDQRLYSFTAFAVDSVDAVNTSDLATSIPEIESKIERLMNAHDVILDYLQAIPGTVDALNGLGIAHHVSKVEVVPGGFDYFQGDAGIEIQMSLNFSVYVSVDVHSI